ncbi:MAG TPA: error-prone DNA polymerase [Verrucomicrobiae bacterium]|nr:error-prone DNA polymerase [Verrucomicrobiae bacterium]
MRVPAYVEFHAKSAFSFLEAASVPEDLAAKCADLDQPALALTDAHGVYGAPRFHLAAKKLGVRALIGAEVDLVSGARLTLVVENRTGYQNLCRLITKINFREGLQGKPESPAATEDELAQFAEGLICLTGGVEGPLARQCTEAGNRDCVLRAQREVERLCYIYGTQSVYVELQRHFCREQEARNRVALDIAKRLQLPLLATNAVTYATARERPLLDVLTCVHHHTTLDEAGTLLSRNSERYLKTASVMHRLFAELPEAVENTVILAERLQFTLTNLGYEFPRYPTPEGEPEIEFLRKRTYEGMIRHYGANNKKAQQQIEHELALIGKLNLPGYFLIVWDIVEFCRHQGILVQGRGSAANSAVCYALGITAVDPVSMELLFERFLSEERGEWPDIDLDLPSDTQREKAIQYLFRRYGERGAAMTANVITYRGRSAVRDVGKTLGFGEEELGRLAMLMPRFEWKDPQDTLERRFRECGLDPTNRRMVQFFALTNAILGLPRHLGQHSGGVILCQGRLDQIVPLEPASMPNRVVVQWDKDDCADLGLVKVDLLGLGMLAVLQDSIDVIREHYGDEVDLAHLPQDDPKVYRTLQKADTIGLFQVESRAQQAILPRMKPTKFYDLVVQVAIIRPGPIVGQMLHPFLRRRQGLEEPESLHPSLDQVLARTLGVPLFQEQLLRMAMIVASFSGGEAEDLRRAMGFKRSEKRMQEVETKLRIGMTKNQIAPGVQERIIQSITSFALYGFPESHAASFALLAYASAYLKCHYLAAFTICMLNNQPMGFYSPATLVKDAQRHGQHFYPVDILYSDVQCTIETKRDQKIVRLGLNYVRGLGNETALAIVAVRGERVFSSLEDLQRRVPQLNKKEMAALASLGALNSLPRKKANRHRRGALWEASAAARPVGPLLENIAEENAHSPLVPLTESERTVADFQNSGLTIGKHPMAFHRNFLRSAGILAAEAAKLQPHGRMVKVAGCVICRQRPGTAKGFVFLSLEDETGIINVIVNPDLFDRKRIECSAEPYLRVEGLLQNTWTVISVKAVQVEALRLGPQTVASHDFH